jgi:hypothetical protein
MEIDTRRCLHHSAMVNEPPNRRPVTWESTLSTSTSTNRFAAGGEDNLVDQKISGRNGIDWSRDQLSVGRGLVTLASTIIAAESPSPSPTTNVLLELDVVRCNWKCSTQVGLLGHVTNYFSFSRPTARMNDLRVFFHCQCAVRRSRRRAPRPSC